MDYDWIIIGSGFGGSVSALRLAEKGYRVAVLECGRRFADDEFPKNTADLRRYFWNPRLGMGRLRPGLRALHPLPCGLAGEHRGHAPALPHPLGDEALPELMPHVPPEQPDRQALGHELHALRLSELPR